MNPKTVLVAVGSAVFAAGLTFWVVSPVRNGPRALPMAKVTPPPPAGPPLVISKAGPEPVPLAVPSPIVSNDPAPIPAASKPVGSKPSPMGDPVQPPPSAAVPVPIGQPAVTPAPVEPPATPPQPEPTAPTPVAAAPPAVRQTPAPPAHVALNPPKEADRAEPAVLRDRESSGPNTTTVAQGTVVTVRLGEALSSQKNLTGDTFFATLDQPLVAGGFVIAEKGARVEGKIVEVDKAKGVGSTSRILLELTQVNTSDGQRIHVQTSTLTKDGGDRNHDKDAAKIGGGAILGAVIGAAAGGGKGAAIGAGAGAAAGGGAVLLSGGRNLNIPVETRLTFRIERPVTITERVVQ
jgi:hypothetical protein